MSKWKEEETCEERERERERVREGGRRGEREREGAKPCDSSSIFPRLYGAREELTRAQLPFLGR